MTLPSLTDLVKGLLRQKDSSASGFQKAHMYGDAFWNSSLEWLSKLGGSMSPAALGLPSLAFSQALR
jgi:hypothetical protein